MTISESKHAESTDRLGIVKLLAGITLLVSLSWEIIAGDHRYLSMTYLTIQFFVCVIFLYDFLLRILQSEHRGRFFVRHLFYLLISIPYLTLISSITSIVPQDGLLSTATGLINNFDGMKIGVKFTK